MKVGATLGGGGGAAGGCLGKSKQASQGAAASHAEHESDAHDRPHSSSGSKQGRAAWHGSQFDMTAASCCARAPNVSEKHGEQLATPASAHASQPPDQPPIVCPSQ